ncbi:MAG: PQQ-dependent sugar dehydrogenase, partial [Ardenticatenaceae bacterium]
QPAVVAGQGVEWPEISLTPVVGGLSSPVYVTHAGDGSERIFIVEQVGRIRIFQDGALLSPAFLDIGDRVSCCGEQGLLGLAFPPEYASKGYFYVNYTDLVGDTVVARYHLTADPNVADPESEQILLEVDQPYANHNGGYLGFGPDDGYLYITLGDGGSGGDPQENAQDPTTLLGKILRIDVENSPDPFGYLIPPTNPYTDTTGYLGEIWALGVRNPWRLSFDRLTYDLYMGDVGQGAWEEINFQPASSPGGENYGWDCYEGNHSYEPEGCGPASDYVFPVTEYSHSFGCSVTGGYVYRGPAYPRMQDVYFYGDYCSGRIWGLQHTGSEWVEQLLLDSSESISSFGEDEAGNLYLTDLSGTVFEVVDSVAATATPTPTQIPPSPTAISTATATLRPATTTPSATAQATQPSTATALATNTSAAAPPTSTTTATSATTPNPTHSATAVGPSPTATATSSNSLPTATPTSTSFAIPSATPTQIADRPTRTPSATATEAPGTRPYYLPFAAKSDD